MWSKKSYTVCDKSSLILQGVELSFHPALHLPYVSAISKMTLTTAAIIEIGDILFCVNDKYISPSEKESLLLDAIVASIKSVESCTLRLIHNSDVMYPSTPFYQIVLTDDKIRITLGRDIIGETNVIQAVNKVNKQYLVGSILCGINETNAIHSPVETLNDRLKKHSFPTILLLASPIQKVLVNSVLVEQHMAPYAVDLRAGKEDISTNKYRTDPFGALLNLDALAATSSEQEKEDENGDDRDESSEWYVETMDEGVDHYMFPRTMGYLVLEKQYELFMCIDAFTCSHRQPVISERNQHWDEFVKKIEGVEHLSFNLTRQSGNRWKMINVTQKDRNRDELRRLIHQGIPDYLRGDVWYYLSGAAEMRSESTTTYAELCALEVDPDVKRMVALDLPRTFANNPLFTQTDKEAPYVTMLRSILYATSQTRKDIKYCQGLNYLAALLLLVQNDEERAFWTLNAIMDHLFPKDYFNEQLTGARIDQMVLEMLVTKQNPDLKDKLESAGFQLVVFTLPWFICLFINTLPFISVMRVWDVIMFEGDKALIRIALALISIGEKDLMMCSDFSEFSNTFKRLGMLLFDADNLLDVAYQQITAKGAKERVVFFRRKDLEKWRNTFRQQL